MTTNNLHPTHQYAQDVVDGKIVAGPYVRAECRRHLNDLLRKDIYFCEKSANRAFKFFRKFLRLNGGQFEGLPFKLEPAQLFIVGSIFGWKKSNEKKAPRRFRRAYIEQAKGNGKSPLVAGLGLYMLIGDKESRAEVYAIAGKKDQAMVLFRDAIAMVGLSPDLQEMVHIVGKTLPRKITFTKPETTDISFMEPLSADKATSGPRPHGVLADEVHEHKNKNLIEMLERGFKFREQPLLIMITNSGHDKNSYCYEEHTAAIKIATGQIDKDDQFNYVCALDKEDDPFVDPSCWVKANPLLGVILTEEYLAANIRNAKSLPSQRNNILRLHFCVWTDSDVAWLSREVLEQNIVKDLDIEKYRGRKAYVGLDLSHKHDLTALVVFVEDGYDEQGKPKFAVFPYGWIAGLDLDKRSETDHTPYNIWARDGHLHHVEKEYIWYPVVVEKLKELALFFDIRSVAFDTYLSEHFLTLCENEGLILDFVEHPQGWNKRRNSPLWMQDSLSAAELFLTDSRLSIQNSPPLISGMMGATVVTSPQGVRALSKQKSTTRIDLAVAFVIAAGIADYSTKHGTGSIYENSDFWDQRDKKDES